MSQEAHYVSKKSTCERYEIRFPGSYVWAVITIDDTGMFNAQSDYGNYSYYWGSFGKCFKSFLIEICERCKENPLGYLYNKLHDHNESGKVRVNETISDYKRELFRNYRKDLKRKDTLFRTDVRDCFDALQEMEDEHCEVSQDFFFTQLMHDSRIKEELICWEYIVCNFFTSHDRGCEAFCREIAPVFAEVLRKELIGQQEQQETTA